MGTQHPFTGQDQHIYYFQIKARDKAGNESEWTEKSTKIEIPKDTTRPIVSFGSLSEVQNSLFFTLSWTGEDPAGAVTPSGVDVFSLTVTPAVDGIKYLKEGNWKNWVNPLELESTQNQLDLSGKDGVEYTFIIQAIDKAGNESEPDQVSTKIILPKTVVINEVQIADEEFIELYNFGEKEINLSNWYFSYYPATLDEEGKPKYNWNSPYRNKKFPDGTTISAESYYLIGLKDYPEQNGNPNADWQVYSSSQLSNTAGAIAIFPWDPTKKSIEEAKSGRIDALGWGEAKVFEENPAPVPAKDKSLQRRELGKDTDDNSQDFVINESPTPTNSKGEIGGKTGPTILSNYQISENTLFSLQGSPYIVTGSLTITQGKTLIIEPGVILKFDTNSYLEINGTLKAIGTENQKITFTRLEESGYWWGIYFSEKSSNSELNWTKIEYAATHVLQYGNPSSSIIVEGSNISFKNSIIENYSVAGLRLKNSPDSLVEGAKFLGSGQDNSNFIGIEVRGGRPTIRNSFFKNNYYGIYLPAFPDGQPLIENNNFEENRYPIWSVPQVVFKSNQGQQNINDAIFLTGYVNENLTLLKNPLPYAIDGPNQFIGVSQGETLTIEPGVIIKFGVRTRLEVKGQLLAQGTSEKIITFTSLGGGPGGYSINFYPESQNSILKNVIVEYGGYYIWLEGSMPMISIENSQVALSDLIVRNSANVGIKILGSDKFPQFGEGMFFQNNASYDIFIEDTTNFCTFLPAYLKSYKTNCPL